MGCRIAEPDIGTRDLAVGAGRAALQSADTDADFVLLATTTPGSPMPGDRPRSGPSAWTRPRTRCGRLGCVTGFLYGLVLGKALVTSGVCRRPLVISAEVYASIIDPLDRNISVIFGDGARAVLLRGGDPCEAGVIHAATLGSDGAGVDLITLAADGSRHPRGPSDTSRKERYFPMQGPGVQAFPPLARLSGPDRPTPAAHPRGCSPAATSI